LDCRRSIGRAGTGSAIASKRVRAAVCLWLVREKRSVKKAMTKPAAAEKRLSKMFCDRLVGFNVVLP